MDTGGVTEYRTDCGEACAGGWMGGFVRFPSTSIVLLLLLLLRGVMEAGMEEE